MTTGRTVDVERICRRPLELFVNGHNAWGHMCDHVLGLGKAGEEQGWGVLLPSLQSEVSAGELANLRNIARATGLDPGHARLGPIYHAFLDRVQRSVERAARLGWFWEQKPGSDCRWFTFSPEGIIACLDSEFVRTGYLLECDSSKWSGSTGVPHFRLFHANLARIQAKYNRVLGSRNLEKIEPELERILRSGLAEADWHALPS